MSGNEDGRPQKVQHRPSAEYMAEKLAGRTPGDTMIGKLGLLLPNGHRIMVGSSLGSLGFLAWIAVQATSFVNQIMDEAEATRDAVETLGNRLDGVDAAISKLSDNAGRIERLSIELADLRRTNAQLSAEIAATAACARDRKRCT